MDLPQVETCRLTQPNPIPRRIGSKRSVPFLLCIFVPYQEADQVTACHLG